jgi:hypothetical protein
VSRISDAGATHSFSPPGGSSGFGKGPASKPLNQMGKVTNRTKITSPAIIVPLLYIFDYSSILVRI